MSITKYVYLFLASKARHFNQSDYFNTFLICNILLAGAVTGAQTYPRYAQSNILLAVDYYIFSVFLLECILKLVAEGLHPINYLVGRDWKWNWFDSFVMLLSLPALETVIGGDSIAIFRLIRLARLGKIVNRIPELRMIIEGFFGGMKLIVYIFLLLLIVVYIYGVLGISFFRQNDPFHFSNFFVTFITLFRVMVLDNWTVIMMLNIFGCDLGTGYEVYVDENSRTPFNKLYWCENPSTSESTVVIYFVSFILLSSFVILSLFIGAITHSMEESIQNIKEQQEKKYKQLALEKQRFLVNSEHSYSDLPASEALPGGLGDHGQIPFGMDKGSTGSTKMPFKQSPSDHRSSISVDQENYTPNLSVLPQPIQQGDRISPTTNTHKLGSRESSLISPARKLESADSNHNFSLLRGQSAVRMLKQRIKSIRKLDKRYRMEKVVSELKFALGEGALASELVTVEEVDRLSLSKRYEALAGLCNTIMSSSRFANFISLIIILNAILMGAELDLRLMRLKKLFNLFPLFNYIIGVIFISEVIIKIISKGLCPWHYFRDSWNCLDCIVAIVVWIPQGSTFGILRLLRLLRLLKVAKSLPYMSFILRSLSISLSSFGYIIILTAIVYYMFAYITVLLFSKSDPFHFGNLHIALLSIFRLITLDNWSEILYISYYGCDVYPGIYANLPTQCIHPKAWGPFAPILFVVFTLIATHILLTLFIGAVSTSMEEARQEIIHAAIVNRRLKKLASSLNLSPTRIQRFRNVFENFDIHGGGTLDEEELRLGLDLIGNYLLQRQKSNLWSRYKHSSFIDLYDFIYCLCDTPEFRARNIAHNIVDIWSHDKTKRNKNTHESAPAHERGSAGGGGGGHGYHRTATASPIGQLFQNMKSFNKIKIHKNVNNNNNNNNNEEEDEINSQPEDMSFQLSPRLEEKVRSAAKHWIDYTTKRKILKSLESLNNPTCVIPATKLQHYGSKLTLKDFSYDPGDGDGGYGDEEGGTGMDALVPIGEKLALSSDILCSGEITENMKYKRIITPTHKSTSIHFENNIDKNYNNTNDSISKEIIIKRNSKATTEAEECKDSMSYRRVVVKDNIDKEEGASASIRHHDNGSEPRHSSPEKQKSSSPTASKSAKLSSKAFILCKDVVPDNNNNTSVLLDLRQRNSV